MSLTRVTNERVVVTGSAFSGQFFSDGIGLLMLSCGVNRCNDGWLYGDMHAPGGE